jgi:type IV secretory pathway VirB2 component (pilin)
MKLEKFNSTDSHVVDMRSVYLITFICLAVFAFILFSGCMDSLFAFSGTSGSANKALDEVFTTLEQAIKGTWGKIFAVGLVAFAIMIFTKGGILFGFLLVFLAVIINMIPTIIGNMGMTF